MVANLGLPPDARFRGKGAYLESTTSLCYCSDSLYNSTVLTGDTAGSQWNFLQWFPSLTLQSGWEHSFLAPDAYANQNCFTSLQVPRAGVYEIDLEVNLDLVQNGSTPVKYTRTYLVASLNWFQPYIKNTNAATSTYPKGFMKGAVPNTRRDEIIPELAVEALASDVHLQTGDEVVVTDHTLTLSISTLVYLPSGSDLSFGIYLDQSIDGSGSAQINQTINWASLQIALTDITTPKVTSVDEMRYVAPQPVSYYSVV